jgi:hypothetical protein
MRNVVSLYYSFVAEGRLVVRLAQCIQVWDDGKSERHPVIGWIKVQNLPWVKTLLTSIGFSVARKL